MAGYPSGMRLEPIPTDEMGPAERGKGECFASPQEMEGEGWNHWTFKNAQHPVDTADLCSLSYV